MRLIAWFMVMLGVYVTLGQTFLYRPSPLVFLVGVALAIGGGIAIVDRRLPHDDDDAG